MSQDTFFQSQSETQPRLNPPIYRWQEDMPENNQPQLVPPQLIWLNIKNTIWMEIPRYEAIMWGDGFWHSDSIFYYCHVFLFFIWK